MNEIDCPINRSGETLPRNQCDFSQRRFEEDVSFRGTVFEGFADFSHCEFLQGVDFTSAVFKQGASFNDSTFICSGQSVNFTRAVFLGETSFEKTKFGKEAQTFFNDWEIRFRWEGKGVYEMLGRQGKGEHGNKEFKTEWVCDDKGIRETLTKWGDNKLSDAVIENFKVFKQNPRSITFERTRFGAIDLKKVKEELRSKRLIEITEKEETRIKNISVSVVEKEEKKKSEEGLEIYKALFLKNEIAPGDLDETQQSLVSRVLGIHLKTKELAAFRMEEKFGVTFKSFSCHAQGFFSFKSAIFLNPGPVDFSSSIYSNAGDVFFNRSSFANAGPVYFNRSSFANEGYAEFNSASFSNAGSVDFANSSFFNEGEVYFYRSSFSNEGNVSFESSFFSNEGSVNFNSSSFFNEGSVEFTDSSFANEGTFFYSSSFANEGSVNFDGSSYRNQWEVWLEKMIWVNSGSVYFPKMDFNDDKKNERNTGFFECLFLNKGKVKFDEMKMPMEGSFRFQRCHFGDVKREEGLEEAKVIFKNTFFCHATLEGGPIGWLKEKNEEHRKISKILEERDIDPPEKVKTWIKELEKFQKDVIPPTTGVFDEDVVVSFKDIPSEAAKNITFRLVDLSRALFDGMTLTHVELNAPTWRWDKGWGRHILYEEEVIRKKYRGKDPQRNPD